MTKVIELLNAIKQAHGIDSDYGLAKLLELPRGHISEYYSGKRSPNEYACMQIATALTMPLAEVMAIVRIEAEKDEKRRDAWKAYYKSIGGIAASFMMIVLSSVILIITSPSVSHAKTMGYEVGEFTQYKLCAYCGAVWRRYCVTFKTLCAAWLRMLSTFSRRASFAC